ncbi:peptidoglycan-associated lipoprotein [Methylophilaceae bacterium 11]|jgi:peptidoglycan-associated lipoprotein|uniref:peptidoglycan-associated lipoprotein Pal n=1 Tax=unclassified Methylotenera TaxID=2643294 RepID=UPI000370E228|nr:MULTISPECIES: peptidoglycan-associated lipoprotein Pal [unclassified Methylotenera]EUJ11514.1 peptidoglycan-associated lipoprotein [Methylophilaceae bacterium 11]
MNNKLWMTVAMAVFLVACKSAPVTPAKVEDKSSGANTTAPTGNDSDANGIKEVNIDGNANNDANNPLRDPNNILSKRNIYFDYNSDAVKAEFRPIVEAHAQYLKSHQDAKVILQGNTDERGTREYNLSLGQRRSVSVKKALNLLGVQDTQIETVSYGEEKANVNCADEDCFQQNRRVDVVYQGE